MNSNLDQELCKQYPKIFVNRYKSMEETAMCWGFDCGNGWYNIIASLCANIQHHIDWRRQQRASALQYNRCLSRAIAGDTAGLVWYYTYGNDPTPQTYKSVENDVEHARFRPVPELVVQVTADQVKEKFGTLRFYYTGGNEFVRGLVAMAESMSAVTCETCGKPGKRVGGGWVTTLCQEHAEARGIYEDETAEH